ncbi:MAG: hypothetical protein ABIC95_02705 [archaeon]
MNVKEKILAIGIAVVFILFIAYGIQAFYDEPDQEDFCRDIDYSIGTDSCPDQPAKAMEGEPRPMPVRGKDCWCEDDNADGTKVCWKQNPAWEACQQAYDDARELYNRNVFFISIIIGLIVLIIGWVAIKLESVGSGLMGGGTITVIYGTIRYWGDLSDVFRFLILGLALGVLIYLGYRRLTPPSKKKSE